MILPKISMTAMKFYRCFFIRLMSFFWSFKQTKIKSIFIRRNGCLPFTSSLTKGNTFISGSIIFSLFSVLIIPSSFASYLVPRIILYILYSWAFNMTPSFTTNNVGYIQLTYAIFFCQSLLSVMSCFVLFPNLYNFFPTQLGITRMYTSSFVFSAFFKHVMRILFHGPYKQMIWSYTRSIITFMTDQFTFRYRSFMDFPRHPMRSSPFSFIKKMAITSRFSRSNCTSPLPTRSYHMGFFGTRFFNFIHKIRQVIHFCFIHYLLEGGYSYQ